MALQEQLLRLPTGVYGAACPAAGASADWESEKRRILAGLEPDGEQNACTADQERLKLDDLVRRTDELVAEKNQEIEHLRRLLQSQGENAGSVAGGAAAGQQLLDQDAVIRQERESLAQLQQQWREKLAQAEIEVSLERAKIARKHAEIDEKLRHVGDTCQDPRRGGRGPLPDRPPSPGPLAGPAGIVRPRRKPPRAAVTRDAREFFPRCGRSPTEPHRRPKVSRAPETFGPRRGGVGSPAPNLCLLVFKA